MGTKAEQALLSLKKPLQLGDQNPSVRVVQQLLIDKGYKLKGTGYFGGATDTAVEDFQRKHGLSADGLVGKKTVQALLAASPVPVVGDSRPLWVVEALSRIGTKEVPGVGDNPQIVEWAEELGGVIASAYTHDSIPWCALFVGSCLHRVGLKSTGSLLALSYRDYGVGLLGPAVGAIAPMTRKGGGHVAFILGRDRDDNYVCIGGNQSDVVNIRSFPAARLKNFRWPAGVPLPNQVSFEQLPLVTAKTALSGSEA